jgi:hypothetical protein
VNDAILSGNCVTHEVIIRRTFVNLIINYSFILKQKNMKTFTLSIKKSLSLALLSLLLTSVSFAATFTASVSGNYSSTATWLGGVVPPTTLVTDQVIIPSGITVNMDNNVTLNGALAQLNVDGTLATFNSSSLTLNLGTVLGTGSIGVNTLDVNAGSTFSFTGVLTVSTLNAATGISSGADIMVNQALNLSSGALVLLSGGTLDMGNNGTIVLSGGTLSEGAGTIGLTGNYHVTYTNTSAVAGIELNGIGLQNLTVDVNAGNSVTLTSDLTVSGTLALNNGVLILAANNLAVNGQVATTGSGTLTSTAASDISFNNTGGTIGAIMFTGTTSAVNNLSVNVGAGSQASISGTLTINGTLMLNTGALNFNSSDLIISGSISGSGLLRANSSSNLTVNSVGGLTGSLNFIGGGQALNNFTLSVGSGNSVSLSSDLTVHGTLALTTGSNLNLNGNALTLDASSIVSGTGAFLANSASALTINSTAGVALLKIIGTIGDFTVNSAGSSVILAGNLTTDGLFTLQSGTLVLNGFDLMLMGNVAPLNAGLISSTSASDLTVDVAVSTSGDLGFLSSANSVGNFTINVADGGPVSLGTDLYVNGILLFTSGKLNIAGHALLIGNSGSVSGADVGSYIITGPGGYVERNVTSGGSTSVSFPVGTFASFAPANIHLATGSTSGKVQVGVVADVLQFGLTGTDLSLTKPLVDATWDISSTIANNLNMDIELMWSAAMEVNSFDADNAYIGHYINGSWDVNATTAAVAETNGMFSLQRSGITALSPFAVFDNNTFTGVTEISNDTRFEIYPNPAAYTITIQNSTASTEPMNMDVYNSVGQLVLATQLANVTSTVSVENLVSGNYFIKFYNSQVSSSKKFIKM